MLDTDSSRRTRRTNRPVEHAFNNFTKFCAVVENPQRKRIQWHLMTGQSTKCVPKDLERYSVARNVGRDMLANLQLTLNDLIASGQARMNN